MSQLSAIEVAQRNLEECFTKRMADLEAQLHAGGPAKDTVSKVAEEFRTFRELIFSMLKLLRQQIGECTRLVDAIETRHRRKNLIFLGVPEVQNEDCTAAILDILHKKMLLNTSAADFNVCHRIGATNKDHHRPILVRLKCLDTRMSIWRTKSKLKGSPVSIKEFLTKSRQAVFGKSRQYFGVRQCWTQDGVIIIKTANGNRHRLTTMDEFSDLAVKYPIVDGKPTSAKGSVSKAAPAITVNSKLRKT